MKVLSKSRFKQGLECPNKLYFTSNKQYANTKNEDSFLQSLAQGGFQVEALARLHYPDGVFINTENYEYEKAVAQTNAALTQENVVIYEAAFLFENLFVRTDIVVKCGNKIRLIEVKAKSFDSTAENEFIGIRGGLNAGYKTYLFDLAFQKHVAHGAHPEWNFEAWFLMADKSKRSTQNGLNQMFRIPKNGNPRTDIITKATSLASIGQSVLSEINVDEICNAIISDIYKYNDNLGFKEAIAMFADAYQNDKFVNWPTHFSTCKSCEYKCDDAAEKDGLLSGFKHCFTAMHQWDDSDFLKPNAMEIWNFRSGNKLFEQGRYFLDQLDEADFNIIEQPDKLSNGNRQWLQVEKSRDSDCSIYVEAEGLKNEMAAWKYPLHFIDFETSAVALPFTAGRRPYEQVAFQFSHHLYHESGLIEHKTEYISNMAGEFPNFLFVRALRAALVNDEGTIFRFAAHENSILNAIIVQLNESNEADRDELIRFIKSITNSTKNNADCWRGERSMVDLNRVLKDYYYNPYTKGSNSIKAVLPAALQSSTYLKEKYSKPLRDIAVTSKNFPDDFVWIASKTLTVNPYILLAPLFSSWDEKALLETVSEMEGITDGGAAMTAYAKLQYEDMGEDERAEITSGLLKYCELDTLAMVMIYEHFKFDLI